MRDLSPFVIHFILLVVPNIQDAQRGTSYFRSGNYLGRTPSFATQNINFRCKCNKASCQDLNSCY